MTLQELVAFATEGRDDDDPDRDSELQFDLKLSPELRGHPYQLEVASIDYVSKAIWLY